MSSHNLLKEIATLRSLLLDMSAKVDEQLADALNALLGGDEQLADEVVTRDQSIDALELEVDKQCERILALYQPVAVDLRMLLVAEKVNTDLERMGDHCRNVARHVRSIQDASGALAVMNLETMGDNARTMLHRAQDALRQRDRLVARQVLSLDNQVDRLHDQNFEALVTYLKSHPEHAEAVAHLIGVNKAVERFSDHANNIAKAVVFLAEGTDIRHRSVQAQD
ncbi:phosphate signaling complex protein PhoU [Salisaeta longa]|uniref:phosphate signaling complex protein PhoU n=1 Tax=Salisaeta longa TaxID=503170 RepID=UPI0003B47678|nr:phosphate signaling complex protein PhoU [Salisaeta longa]